MATELPAKAASLFDHLSFITDKKRKWETLTEADQKSFSPYLINRWLSMTPELIEYVDMFQRYTIGLLATKDVYKLYYDFLPKKKFFSKYVKGKKHSEYNEDLIRIVQEHLQISELEATDYVEILKIREKDLIFKELLERYGKDEKEIKKLLK
jgi:hypothetical protein